MGARAAADLKNRLRLTSAPFFTATFSPSNSKLLVVDLQIVLIEWSPQEEVLQLRMWQWLELLLAYDSYVLNLS